MSYNIRLELLSLLAVTTNQRCILVNNMEHLIYKLRSMHLDMPRDIGHIYAMQVSLTRAQAAKKPRTTSLPDFTSKSTYGGAYASK